MKKKFIDSIDVKSPCNESWEEMIGNDKVRFCSHCAKNVHNLSAMTREKAEKLVKDLNGKICVIYAKDQSGKVVTAPPKLTQIKRRAAIAAGVLATSLTFSAITYAQGSPRFQDSKSEQTTEKTAQNNPQTQSNSTISGILTDVTGAVISKAKVTLRDVKTGKIRLTQSNEDGFYEFKNVESAIYEIEVEIPGFKKLIMQDIEISENTDFNRTSIMEVSETTIGIVVIADEIKPDDVEPQKLPIEKREIVELPKNESKFFLGLVAAPRTEKENNPQTPKKKKKKN